MFSPIKRFILMKYRQKFFAFLSISVFTFCLIVVFSRFSPHNLGKSINLTAHLSKVSGKNLDTDFLLYFWYNPADSSVSSIERQSVTETKGKTFLDNSNLESNSPGLKNLVNWPERPWFLTNGTLRLSALEASQLALWPEESSDPNDDRIVNQLMYVPINYNNRTLLKSIYLRAMDADWKLSLGRKEFLRCPVSRCQFVPRVAAKRADLIFFKSGSSRNFMTQRKANQIWAKFELESPQNSLMVAPKGTINWTVTYRHDSEISTPYSKFYPYHNHTKPDKSRNYAFGKRFKVAWFVSNCWATNARLEYAKELAKYIDVDVYGSCGTFKCPKGKSSCSELLNKDYKFYLSFENSNCLDYITEKFWLNGLMNDILPIVMGAHPDTYRRLAPPHSYIHVDDFESPKLLAEYLKLLDSNDNLYNKYFEWKGTGQIKQIYMWCRICALLHAPQRHRAYDDLLGWWSAGKHCVPITWTNMTITQII